MNGSRAHKSTSRNNVSGTVELLGSILKGGKNVLPCQFGKIVKNFFLAHARGQIAENVTNGDTEVAYAGLARAFAFGNGD